MEVDFEAHDLPASLSPETSLCFFRVLQEVLHNPAKHSGVRHFVVRLRGTPEKFHLTFGDSGRGFDIEATKASRGLGLISMQERLKLLNGTLSFESHLQRGTTVHASVPINQIWDPCRRSDRPVDECQVVDGMTDRRVTAKCNKAPYNFC